MRELRAPAPATSTARASTRKRGSAGQDAVRFGRPPKEFARAINERVLDAARNIFLERGFEGASIDEIAQAARTGKQTIYARFRNKRELFTEVVARDILSHMTEFETEVPSGATIEERFISAAITLLQWAFDSRRIRLMRLAVAEVRRFPDLAATVSRTARDLGTDLGVRCLGQLAQSNELRSLPAFAPEQLATTARFFLDLVVLPMLLRALFEANCERLNSEINAHVGRSAKFYLVACRHGGVS